MRAHPLLSMLVLATTVVAEDAPLVENNPIGAQYEALIEPKAPWAVSGSVKIASGASGKGVTVEIALAGFPKEGGPFIYHIHEKPVPEDGNCTATGAHLDPYKRGEVPACDAGAEPTCQTGDLSGKHGKITAETFSAVYNDDFLATLPSNPSFFGDKSIVVHLSNKTRIACANFHQLSPGNGTTPSPTTLSSASASFGTALPSGIPDGGHNATSATPAGGDSTGAPIPPTVSPTVSPTDVPAGGAARVTTGGAALFAFAALVMF